MSGTRLKQALEITEIFRHALVPERLGALFRLALLILVIKRRAERMMGVVHFRHEVRDRQLKLMHPELAGFGFRRKGMARAEIKQDVGGLPDHDLAGFKKRRRERRRA